VNTAEVLGSIPVSSDTVKSEDAVLNKMLRPYRLYKLKKKKNLLLEDQ
jgi:hypothetical protein